MPRRHLFVMKVWFCEVKLSLLIRLLSFFLATFQAIPDTVTVSNRREALGSSVLRLWPFFRSVFRFSHQKTAVCRFWRLLRFAGFPFISIWFSANMLAVFRNWQFLWLSVFPFGFRFLCCDMASIMRSNHVPRHF